MRGARAHVTIVAALVTYDKNGVSFSSKKLEDAPGVRVGIWSRGQPGAERGRRGRRGRSNFLHAATSRSIVPVTEAFHRNEVTP